MPDIDADRAAGTFSALAARIDELQQQLDDLKLEIQQEEARFRVNWLEHQPHRCYFYPGRDCPGWHERQPCDPMCQRLERPVPTGVEPVNPDGGIDA